MAGIGRFTSLNYLATLPVDLIKIDKSFLTGIPFAERQAAIVRAIAKLAAELNLMIIAEGVETEAQTQFLMKLGVTTGQWFYYYPALTVTEIEEILMQTAAAIVRP